MTNIHEKILDELRSSKACHVDRFPPFYNFSIGAHLFNIFNKQTQTYFEARRIPDTRLQILFVAPPGGEKTFWMEQYLRGAQALLMDSSIETGWAGTMTEAGFVGTIKFENGEAKTSPGLCMRKSNAIVGIEEFAAISEAMKAEYAKTLDPALLGALDSGWVYKDLAAGPLEYETHLTLWAASVHPASPVIIRQGKVIDIVPICDAKGSEILTRHGFSRLKGTYTHPFKGNLKLINAHGSSILVTPNHAVFNEQQEIVTYKTKTLEVQPLRNLTEQEVLTDTGWAAIQGFYTAEGWLSSHDIPKPWICQKDRTKLDRVIALKPEIFDEPHWYEGNNIWMVRIKSENKQKLYECYSSSGYKKVPRDILNGTDEAKKAFLEYFLLGDGSKPNALWRFHQSIDHMALAAGISYLAQGNPSTRTIRKERSYGTEILLGKHNRRNPCEVKRVLNVPYDGLVWDATTEDSTFVTGVGQWTVVHNTQPARFDLRGGMGRRFLFIYFIPTVKDWREITEARRASKNIRFNPIQTDVIRKELPRVKEKLQSLEKVEWDSSVYRFYDEMKFLPYEEQLYDRMLIGYYVMTGRFDHIMYVKLDDYILPFLKKEAYYRDTIRRGSEFAEVLLILREHNGKMPLFELKDELLAFGKDWQQSAKLLDDLQHIRAIRRTPDNYIELSTQLRTNQ